MTVDDIYQHMRKEKYWSIDIYSNDEGIELAHINDYHPNVHPAIRNLAIHEFEPCCNSVKVKAEIHVEKVFSDEAEMTTNGYELIHKNVHPPYVCVKRNDDGTYLFALIRV